METLAMIPPNHAGGTPHAAAGEANVDLNALMEMVASDSCTTFVGESQSSTLPARPLQRVLR